MQAQFINTTPRCIHTNAMHRCLIDGTSLYKHLLVYCACFSIYLLYTNTANKSNSVISGLIAAAVAAFI